MDNQEQIMNAFKRLIHVLSTGKNRPYTYGDITIHRAEVHILEIIGSNSGITASGIVKAMNVTKGAVSQIVKKLRERRLIEAIETSTDRKVYELHLTKKGKSILEQHDIREKKLLRKIAPEINHCGSADIKRFANVINHVADFIDE